MGGWLRRIDVGMHRGVGLWLLVGASLLVACLVPLLLLAVLPVLTFAFLLGSAPWESTVPSGALGTLPLLRPSPRGPPTR